MNTFQGRIGRGSNALSNTRFGSPPSQFARTVEELVEVGPAQFAAESGRVG